MAKTVQLSDEAYGTLSALKRANESFSDAVLRLARQGKDLGALDGLSPVVEGFDEFRAKMRRADESRLRRSFAAERGA